MSIFDQAPEQPEKELVNRREWLASQIPKRNTKIDNSDSRSEYIDMLCHGSFTLEQMVAHAKSKGDKISRQAFFNYRKQIDKNLLQQSRIGQIIQAKSFPDGVGAIDKMKILIGMVEASLESHYEIDDKSPVVYATLTQRMKLLLDCYKHLDELKEKEKGGVRGKPVEEGGRGIKGIEDYTDEEWEKETKRIALMELERQKVRMQAEKEGRFDEFGHGKTGEN